jgi:hypothetical protein
VNPEDNPLLNCAFPDSIMWRQATEQQKAEAFAVEMLRARAEDSSTITGAEWLKQQKLKDEKNDKSI